MGREDNLIRSVVSGGRRAVIKNGTVSRFSRGKIEDTHVCRMPAGTLRLTLRRLECLSESTSMGCGVAGSADGYEVGVCDADERSIARDVDLVERGPGDERPNRFERDFLGLGLWGKGGLLLELSSDDSAVSAMAMAFPAALPPLRVKLLYPFRRREAGKICV